MDAIAHFNYPGFLSYSTGNFINGFIHFHQSSPQSNVIVTIKLYGLKPGYHGIHVHTKPLTRELLSKKNCCKALGGHFNPFKSPHGSYNLQSARHVGDLCNNIVANSCGIVDYTYEDNLISLFEDYPECIIGHSIVIHEKRDDEGKWWLYNDKKLQQESRVTGNAGGRIGCANIYYI